MAAIVRLKKWCVSINAFSRRVSGVFSCDFCSFAVMASKIKQLAQDICLQEELIVIVATYNLIQEKKKKPKRKHRWWVHDIVKKRRQQGAYHNLVQELLFDNERFKLYFRLSKDQYTQLLALVGADLVKFTRNREVLSQILLIKTASLCCGSVQSYIHRFSLTSSTSFFSKSALFTTRGMVATKWKQLCAQLLKLWS